MSEKPEALRLADALTETAAGQRWLNARAVIAAAKG